MPIVQVEVHMLAEPTDRAGDVQHISHDAAHRVLDVCGQLRQPDVPGAKARKAQAGMAACEPGGRLPYAEVADVDAAADPFGVLELLRQRDEPARLQAGGVLEEEERTCRPLA